MAQDIITIQLLEQNLGILSKLYDAVRIINPLKKKLLTFYGGSLEQSQFSCYGLWARNEICTNCISMKALNQQTTFFKLEYSRGKIYMVSAVPILNQNEILVLELVKDVTSSMMIDDSNIAGNNAILKTLYDLNQMQVKDSLTGLFNRRFIDERLPVDILASHSNSRPLSVILADIDFFKRVNDTYGHIAGDFTLKEFAALLDQCMRDRNGWAARYGGEEFLLVLADAEAAEAESFAEFIRKKVENCKFDYKGTDIVITASFGVSALPGGTDTSTEALIDSVDKNLYKAKQTGRNKVIGITAN